MSDAGDLRARVDAYERRLRQRSAEGTSAATDPALAALFGTIRERRSRRVGSNPDADSLVVDVGPDAVESLGRVHSIDVFGPAVRVLRIGRPAQLSYAAGQYVKIGVAGGKRRKFSVASAPHEPHLDIAVELQPHGAVTPALFELAEGAAVEIAEGAKGRLGLAPTAQHHLMVATVTGIAPLRSMLRDALHQGTTARFTILHGASLATELPFHDELMALAETDTRVTYVPTVSRPDDPANRNWSGETGRVDQLARRLATSFDPAATHVYAVGNAGMVEAIVRDLGGAGFTVSTESYDG